MGLLDRAKRFLGIGEGSEDDEPTAAREDDGEPAQAARQKAPGANAGRGGAMGRAGLRRRTDRERPPLAEVQSSPGQSIEDVLVAREAGDRDEARKILREIDRGSGLRTVLRAAAALEAGDETELGPLLPLVAKEDPAWRLLLQIAGALEDAALARPYIERAARQGAPAWATAWSRALSNDETIRREGLVELLFSDAALARAVAARDLAVAGVTADPDAAQRYASFAHGRDSIRRFGATLVARLIDRAGIGGS
jgi:hypothetical protein